MKRTPSRINPKPGARTGCQCPDGSYSPDCCTGLMGAQGIGPLTGQNVAVIIRPNDFLIGELFLYQEFDGSATRAQVLLGSLSMTQEFNGSATRAGEVVGSLAMTQDFEAIAVNTGVVFGSLTMTQDFNAVAINTGVLNGSLTMTQDFNSAAINTGVWEGSLSMTQDFNSSAVATVGSGYANQEITDWVDAADLNTWTKGTTTEIDDADLLMTDIKSVTGSTPGTYIDVLCLFRSAAGDINWRTWNLIKQSSFPLSIINTVTAVLGGGVKGNGSTAYLRIDNYWAGATGAAAQQNDQLFSVGYYGFDDSITNNTAECMASQNFGGSSNRNMLYKRDSAVQITYDAHLSTADTSGTATVFQGNQASFDNLQHDVGLIRKVSTSYQLLSDGIQTKTRTANSAAPAATAWNLLRADDNSKYCLYIGEDFVIGGGGLSQAQWLTILSYINAYVQGI